MLVYSFLEFTHHLDTGTFFLVPWKYPCEGVSTEIITPLTNEQTDGLE